MTNVNTCYLHCCNTAMSDHTLLILLKFFKIFSFRLLQFCANILRKFSENLSWRIIFILIGLLMNDTLASACVRGCTDRQTSVLSYHIFLPFTVWPRCEQLTVFKPCQPRLFGIWMHVNRQQWRRALVYCHVARRQVYKRLSWSKTQHITVNYFITTTIIINNQDNTAQRACSYDFCAFHVPTQASSQADSASYSQREGNERRTSEGLWNTELWITWTGGVTVVAA